MFREIIWRIIYGGGILFDLTKWLILILVVFLLVNNFLISIFLVDGLSMYPTLKNHDVILWSKIVYDKETPERGDIVAVNYPGDLTKKYVKRIVGLPGDEIKVKSGKVFVNGTILNEEYLSNDIYTEPDGVWRLSDSQYFVMGDNRENSSDSRAFGPVESRFVLGKALYIVFPHISAISG